MSYRFSSFLTVFLTTITIVSAAPFVITENRGQWDSQVKFRADGGNGWNWYFTDTGPVVDVTRIDEITLNGIRKADLAFDDVPPVIRTSGHVFQIEFVGANTAEPYQLVGSEKLSWNNNYFYGNDPSKWVPNCQNYSTVTYSNVWKGVDVLYRTNERAIKFECVCEPGASLHQLQFRFHGLTEPLAIDPINGDLIIPLSIDTPHDLIPYAYQIVNGRTIPVPARYRLLDRATFGFEFPQGYDSSLPLVIDPIMSSFLGGTSSEISTGMVPTRDGFVVTGYLGMTTSFPHDTGAYQRTYQGGNYDGFVSKFSSDLSTLQFSTYLGSPDVDQVRAVVVDPDSGFIYVSGQTNGRGFPIPTNGFQPTHGGTALSSNYDGFVVKLNSSGSQLLGGSFIGGAGTDRAWAIARANSGNIVVGGVTLGTDFPVSSNATQPTYGGNPMDGFVAEFNPYLTGRVFSTYRGGSDSDQVYGVTTYHDTVYVFGETKSTNLSMPANAYQSTNHGGLDAFVTAWSPNGSAIISGSYLGGAHNEFGRAICIDTLGNIYCTGYTYSDSTFPRVNASQSMFGGASDAFISRFSHNCDSLVCSSFYGGTGIDQALAICLGTEQGQVMIAGNTNSPDLPLMGEQTAPFSGGSSSDAFVYGTSTGSDGMSTYSATYLGGSGIDAATAVLDYGAPIIYGYTYSSNFPTPNGFQTQLGGGSDVFMAIYPIDISAPEAPSPATLPTNSNLSVFPNPWNNLTTVTVRIPQQEPVKITLVDVLGRTVQTIRNGVLPVGTHHFTLNGERTASGLYFLRLQSKSSTKTIKTILLH